MYIQICINIFGYNNSGGGEEAPTYMSAAEFGDYIKLCMGSGLGLDITIENGVATEIGIWS